MSDDLAKLLPAKHGHYLYESGHHAALWLDLELLFLHPNRIQPFARQLAEQLAPYGVSAVCGPLVEGAFVALTVAAELEARFTYSERIERHDAAGLYPVIYRIPGRLRDELRGQRTAIVNDVISAGSAVLGTLADLEACGADVVAVGTLATLGESFPQRASEAGIPLESILNQPNEIWTPADCPLCAKDVPLTSVPRT